MFFHHRFHQCLQPFQCFVGLGASGQWQFVVELCPLLLTLIRLFSRLFNPVLGADTCTSPFFTMRIDNLLVRLYVTLIAIFSFVRHLATAQILIPAQSIAAPPVGWRSFDWKRPSLTVEWGGSGTPLVASTVWPTAESRLWCGGCDQR